MTITNPCASRAVNASESNRQSRPAIKLADVPFDVPPEKPEPAHAARALVSRNGDDLADPITAIRTTDDGSAHVAGEEQEQ